MQTDAVQIYPLSISAPPDSSAHATELPVNPHTSFSIDHYVFRSDG